MYLFNDQLVNTILNKILTIINNMRFILKTSLFTTDKNVCAIKFPRINSNALSLTVKFFSATKTKNIWIILARVTKPTSSISKRPKRNQSNLRKPRKFKQAHFAISQLYFRFIFLLRLLDSWDHNNHSQVV